MSWIGLDIGGANLKAASSCGRARSTPFPLWSQKESLESALAELIRDLEVPTEVVGIAAVMTGELADCFSSKQEGVEYIVDGLGRVCRQLGIPAPMFGDTQGKFVGVVDAKRDFMKVAAANWFWLAKFVCQQVPDRGILIDCGSTTMDVIPFENGTVAVLGKTDLERLKHGELLYMGVGRTPIFGLLEKVHFQGSEIAVANELFATTKDALVVAGILPANPADTETADGRARTLELCRHRLARCVCADEAELPDGFVAAIADQTLEKMSLALSQSLQSALDRFPDAKSNLIVSGAGADWLKIALARHWPDASLKRFADLVGQPENVSEVGPAFAVAILAMEHHP